MKWFAALGVAVLLLAGLVPSSAAAGITITPGDAVSREPITVTGTLPSKVERPVTLQRKDGARWVEVATKRSTAKGKVTFRVPAARMTLRITAPSVRVKGKRYRAYTSKPRAYDVKVPQSIAVGRAALGPRAGRTSEFGAAGASISANGRYVAFSSYSSDLVAGDANGYADIFVWDRQSGDTEMVSFRTVVGDSNGDSYDPMISPDGGSVVFTSGATTLVAADGNGSSDVFVWDRGSSGVERVSVASGGGAGNGDSFDPSIAGGGNAIAFTTRATNLVPDDTNVATDVLVRARASQTTTLVSRTPGGAVGNDNSGLPSVSSDGAWVAFETAATDIAPGDTNGEYDVVRRPLFTNGPTRLVSVRPNGSPGNGISAAPSISADGKRVAFESIASNLAAGDTNTRADVFVWDAGTGRTTLVSRARSAGGGAADAASTSASISGDGRFVGWASAATDLAPGDANGITDVFVRNLAAGVTSTVSAFLDGSTPVQESRAPSLSRDGRYVAYQSGATAFAFDDDNGYDDVFRCDRRANGAMS